jgi:hypothetical protein
LGISPLFLQIFFVTKQLLARLVGLSTKISMATSELDTDNVISVTEANLREE